MKFQLLHAALDDLDSIYSWVTEHFGPVAAASTYERLFSEFALLADFPRLGRERPEITARPLRFFLSGHYWIVYEAESPLLIHRLLHPARDMESIEL